MHFIVWSAIMEEYIAVCRKHPYIIIRAVVIGLAIFLFSLQWEGNALYNIVRIGIPLLIIVSAVIKYKTNYIAVTRTKIDVHMGFIKTTDSSTPLNKIQAISLSSGLFGKIFGYHKITIDHAGTGKSEYQFGHMSDAKDFANVVERMAGLK